MIVHYYSGRGFAGISNLKERSFRAFAWKCNLTKKKGVLIESKLEYGCVPVKSDPSLLPQGFNPARDCGIFEILPTLD